MFLSFIVPVYNVEKYLTECLDSLLNQDIPHGDYEIICVNDGSTDGSPAILRDYAAKHVNIRVITQKNSGLSAARNVGLDAAHGAYIWFVDSDDFVQEYTLLSLKKLLSTEPCDRLHIGTYTFTEQLTIDERVNARNHQLKVNSHFYDSVVWSSIFRRAFLLEHNCRFHYTDITHGEDTVFMYEFISHRPSIKTLDIPLYFYRIRQGSLQTVRNKENEAKKLFSYVRISEVMQEHYLHAAAENKQAAANTLMIYLWNTLLFSTRVSLKAEFKAMRKLQKLKLFPYRRPVECTQTKSYQTTRTDFIGKLYDTLYLHLHRPWGYGGMWLLQRAIAISHIIKDSRAQR